MRKIIFCEIDIKWLSKLFYTLILMFVKFYTACYMYHVLITNILNMRNLKPTKILNKSLTNIHRIINKSEIVHTNVPIFGFLLILSSTPPKPPTGLFNPLEQNNITLFEILVNLNRCTCTFPIFVYIVFFCLRPSKKIELSNKSLLEIKSVS